MIGQANDSCIVSWNYERNSEGDLQGVVLLGRKDPLGIEQRIEIVDGWVDDEGLAKLEALGVNLDI